MLYGILIIISVGFIAGEFASRLRLPRLIGMLVVGIAIGPSVLDVLPQPVLDISAEIRLFTLLVILLKAGLGLDKEKILAQGSVAIRLGFLPAVIEATVVAVATRYIFGWDWISAWLVGWIICAASPAVIVPMMLRLKAEGWGVKKGIPDLILAGGTASDAVAVTMFGIFVAWATGDVGGGIGQRLANIPVQIILGVLFGIAAGKLVVILVKRLGLADNTVHEGLIAIAVGMLLVIGESILPYSPFLAVMVMGFVILETD
ncbi:MAG: sodium:proton antiporter, partial [Spirochaetaceae bacterium]